MANNLELLYYVNKSYEELVNEILELTKEKGEYIKEIEKLENKIEDLEIDLRLSCREIEKLKGRDLI